MSTKQKADLIIGNSSELITCASGLKAKKGAAMLDIGRVENGWFAVKDGVIMMTGTEKVITEAFDSADYLDAENRSVVPGFVESHTHIVYGGNRIGEFELRIKGAGYLEIFEAGGGIHSSVAATRAATVEELFDSASVRLNKLVSGGVTTCEIKTGYGLNTKTELKMLDVIIELDKRHAADVIPTFLPAHAIPQEWKGKEEEFTDLICNEMIPAASKRLQDAGFGGDKPYFIDVFCEKGAFDLDQSKKVILTAQKHGFRVKAHVDEFTNMGCARFAIENGAVSVDHLDATSDGEIKLLAESSTVGIVTPTVNFNFGSSEFADARKMIDAGCAIALSTDYNPGSAPCPSIQTAMAIACRYQKLLPAEALTAATVNGAAAVGCVKNRGSIETGKAADFLILDTSDYREICYEFGWNFVELVYKNGSAISPFAGLGK